MLNGAKITARALTVTITASEICVKCVTSCNNAVASEFYVHITLIKHRPKWEPSKVSALPSVKIEFEKGPHLDMYVPCSLVMLTNTFLVTKQV
jgi:hypothetical protein